jgi:glycosyltransferase involved in cell wall biosynthesis
MPHQWYDESILNGYTHKFLANYSWKKSPSAFFGTINPGVLRELSSGRYDAILIHGYADLTAWLAMVAAKRRSSRVLFRGETALRQTSRPIRKAVRWAAMQALTRLVDVFLPIGTRSREFYLRYGIPSDRLVLSPYTVDNDFFISQANLSQDRKRKLLESLGVSAGVPVILYVSKMTSRKRPLDLIKAFEKLHEPAFLLFVGDGPLRAEIESYVASRHVRNVRCVGLQRQENLSQFYAISDMFVLPSEHETWGLVINEAMCFSLPIITTYGVSSSADLVSPGCNGFLYEAGNIGALHRVLENLLSDPEKRREMGRHSRKIIQEWDPNASVHGICRGISMALAHR